jgi:hypothetical protein
MKIALTLVAALFLSACSVSVAHKSVVPVRSIESTQRVHFVQLMEIVRDNYHKAPTPELKEQVIRLVRDSGLEQKCQNKRCWLQYKDLRITTEEEYIVIEISATSYIRVDIRDPRIAAKVIYG